MNDTIVAFFVVLGGFFAAIAGIGVLRLPDVLIRMHASTKAGTLGVGLIVIGVAVHFAEALVVTKAVLITVFLLLTAPVAAHLIGRAAYRSRTPLWTRTLMDDEPMRRASETGTSAVDTQARNVLEEPDEPDNSRPPLDNL